MFFINRMPIRMKLIGGFIIILISMTVGGWQGIAGMKYINAALNSINKDQFIPTQTIAEANIALIAWNRAILNHIVAEESQNKDNYTQIMVEQKNILAERLEFLRESETLSEKGRMLAGRLLASLQEAEPIRDHLIGLSESGYQEKARKELHSRLRSIIDEMDSMMTKFLLLQKKQLAETLHFASERYQRSLAQILLIIGSSLAISFLIAFYLSNMIVKGVNEATQISKKVLKDLLKEDLPEITATDEIRLLGTVIEHLHRSLANSLAAQKETENALLNYTDQLEEKVEARTVQLKNELFERELAEDMLRKSERYFRSMLFSMHDEILVINGNYRVTDVNKDFLEVFGRKRDQVIGYHLTEISNGFDELCDDRGGSRGLREVFLTGKPQTYRLELVTADDSKVWAENLLSPLKDADGNITHVIMAVRDIDQEIKLEQQLRHTQKMEAIGTLAGGIAHDFNNTLMTIIMNLEFALRKLPKATTVNESLQISLQAADRARELVEQILTFSRRSEEDILPLSVTPIVKESLKLLRSSLPTTINICQHLEVRSDTVIAAPTHIHQILINLCTNAAHAMEESGGTLTVSLIETFVDSDDAERNPELKPGPYLRLTVKDTGRGMSPEIINRIFEPFFTTKKIGEGTGMGLAVVHGIIDSVGGTIRVESKPGKGSVFDVFLPKIDKKEDSEIELYSIPSTGNGRILIVDDEKLLAESMQKALSDIGYHVTAKTSSMQALYEFQQNSEQFDIVITDFAMPNMTGIELTKEILSIRHDIPIILCTGYDEPISGEEAVAIGVRRVLTKPVATSELSDIILNILEKTP